MLQNMEWQGLVALPSPNRCPSSRSKAHFVRVALHVSNTNFILASYEVAKATGLPHVRLYPSRLVRAHVVRHTTSY